MEARVRANTLRELRVLLLEYVDTIPNVNEFVEGIPHYNDSEQHQGVQFAVVRAIHSTNMQYYSQQQHKDA